ncbi:MAG: hypothetical protein ACJ746_22765 [Bryobacteraceae bacterium]
MADSPGLFFQEALQQVDALETKVEHLQWWLVIAVCFLTVGLILEYYEHLPVSVILFGRKVTHRARGLQRKHIPQKVGRCVIVLALGTVAIVVFASMWAQTRLREANGRVMAGFNDHLWGEGARGRLLLGDRRHRMIAPLKHFGGSRVELRYCEESSTDREINDFIGLLNVPILRASGWRISKPTPVDCQGKTGVMVQVLPSSSSRTKNAAKSLVSALMNNHLDVFGGRVMDWPDGDPLPRDSNTVVVYVFPRS